MMSLCIASSAFAQYCYPFPPSANAITPITGSNPGFAPSYDALPCIVQGTNVSDTIYFTIYTLLGSQAVDSMKIDSIGNLPPGLCWTSNTLNSTFAGGQTAAILISGTTIAPAGQYALQIYVEGTISSIILPPYTSLLQLADAQYYLRVVCSSIANCSPVDTIDGRTTPFIADTSCSVSAPFSVSIHVDQTTTCAGSSVILIASNTSPNPVSYLWSTGQTSDTITVNPYYSGPYTLYAFNDSGATAADTVNISVIHTANAYFNLQPDSAPHVWDIINYCTGADLSYVWSWGDGTTTATMYDTASHTYDSAGYYTVCVYITDSLGCSASYCDSSVYLFKDQSGQMVQINVKPIATGITPVIASAHQISYYGGAVHFSEAVTVPADVRLYDLSGREMMRHDAFTGNVLPLNGAISQGVYIISLRNNNYIISKKVTILQ